MSSIAVLCFQVTFVQNGNLFGQVVQTGIIADDIISQLQPFGARGLPGDNGACFRFRQATAPDDPRNLGIFLAIHHQHALHQLPERGAFRQQRHDDEDIGVNVKLAQRFVCSLARLRERVGEREDI